jgi:hypothetical protein
MHISPSGWWSKAGLLAYASLSRGCLPGCSPVALQIHALALCAYSYGVVADSHRASRHLAVDEWLQAERLSSGMKLFCEVLQGIDRDWTGKVNPIVDVVHVMLLDGGHTGPSRPAL